MIAFTVKTFTCAPPTKYIWRSGGDWWGGLQFQAGGQQSVYKFRAFSLDGPRCNQHKVIGCSTGGGHVLSLQTKENKTLGIKHVRERARYGKKRREEPQPIPSSICPRSNVNRTQNQVLGLIPSSAMTVRKSERTEDGVGTPVPAVDRHLKLQDIHAFAEAGRRRVIEVPEARPSALQVVL